MHHKYAVRDDDAVWTMRLYGRSTVAAPGERDRDRRGGAAGRALPRQLRRAVVTRRRRAQRPHRAAADPGGGGRGALVTGHGEQLSQRIATAIEGRERVRIASPVITSGPVLATLAELADRGTADVMGVVDPQVAQVFRQWAENPNSSWKIPLLGKVWRPPLRREASTPWRPDGGVHDFMHCKLTVADDVAFLGSFNLSRSGEQNAENMLEIRDAGLADRLAGFVDEIRSSTPRRKGPRRAASRPPPSRRRARPERGPLR